MMPGNVKQIFNGFDVGARVQSGAKLTTCASEKNPCRQAYIDWLGEGKSRFSWDPISILIAVRGVTQIGLNEVNQGQKATVEKNG